MENTLKFAHLFEGFHTLFKCSIILAQSTPKIIFLEVFEFFWHPSHSWTWLNSGDITIFKMIFHIFYLQSHLGGDLYKWKIDFKLSCIDFSTIMYHCHGFWWLHLKKCLTLRHRLLETCKATAVFALFSGFGWHRRGDPLKSKKNSFVQSCSFWEEKIFCL